MKQKFWLLKLILKGVLLESSRRMKSASSRMFGELFDELKGHVNELDPQD